ncbi:HAD-IC family P-type ATPase [Candidatus Saccharibacteria bacterium]|nr:HAD-IC family P-type ATPase [Candidatus Saccharibacteria bacterium]
MKEGLTSAEVAAKVQAGKVNHTAKQNTMTVRQIILRNTLTIFNLVNIILAVMILFVGSYKNLLFIFIAIANTLIGIINELRAKRTVDKMKLLAEQKPTVIRDGNIRQIPPEELVEDDLMILSLGDQILVDAIVEQGSIEVNESLLTGESDNIRKTSGDKLISGSFIVSGTCQAKVTAVGDRTFIAKLESSARTIHTTDSKLFTLMNKIVKYISFALIPIGVLLLLARFRVAGTTTETAVTSTVAALINMIPEGLILLTSSVLALATIRLSRKKVLVQNLYSIETLARVDCICLDKTGTLTTGKMTVHDFTSLDETFESAIVSILNHQTAENATTVALKQKFLKKSHAPEIKNITDTISFSSDRKHSGIQTKTATYLLGAVEFITDDKALIEKVKDASGGYRTLAVVKSVSTTGDAPGGGPLREPSEGGQGEAGPVVKKDNLLGYIRLKDEIRGDAHEIIQFFADNNVAVKVISGDDLDSVKTIAERVGLKDLRGINLSTETSHNYAKLVQDYNVFTRVKPAEKKEIIKALKKEGCTVAMTGDGVNDILAMKEADCSIAIGDGADAARRSSQIVLLGSDFSTVPDIIAEGRQSINNLERSATLFLTKTAYAAILAVLFVFIPIEYPFSPISMSLLNFLCIGFPGFVLALEPNIARVKDQFIYNIKHLAIPTGIIISLVTLVISIIADANNIPRNLFVTISIIAVFVLDYGLLYRISRPPTKLRIALLAIILAVFLGALFIPPIRNFFDFYPFF